jgi:hypothetical protein
MLIIRKLCLLQTDYEALKQTCNLWRNYVDVQDSWEDVAIIISYYAVNQDKFAGHAGPGHWNDPDMVC